MAAERAKSRPAGLRHLASNTLRDLIDWRRLRGVRHRFDGLMWMLQVGRGVGLRGLGFTLLQGGRDREGGRKAGIGREG